MRTRCGLGSEGMKKSLLPPLCPPWFKTYPLYRLNLVFWKWL
jgi:hypothetical protein